MAGIFLSGMLACLDALKDARIFWPRDEVWEGLTNPNRLKLGAGIALILVSFVMSVVRQRSAAGTNGIPRATYSPTYTNFAPRIGVAWRPMKSERWVVRSGYGIFYDASIANINIFPRINPPFYRFR